ncbi:MAG: hypothetical protein AMXMBFR13_43980 [Phycisphaerae bacterium]
MGVALWTPLLIGLAYLPDITSELARLAGLGAWRTAAHSFLFAFVVALPLGAVLARLTRIRLISGAAIVLFSVLAHDLLDLLQANANRPFWPFSQRTVGHDSLLIPNQIYREVVVFAFGFAAFLVMREAWSRLRRRRFRNLNGATPFDVPVVAPRYRLLVWAGRVGVGLIFALAAGTHYVRDLRAGQLRDAFALLHRRQPVAALGLIDQAARWPNPSGPARIDYARAEAYLLLGNRAEAERQYLAAYTGDPSYFWTVADLAVFYAASDEPLEIRRQKAAPWIQELESRFADHADMPRRVARARALLGLGSRPASGPARAASMASLTRWMNDAS